MTMNELIMKAREKKCSDIHISEGMPVSFRIHGQLLDSGFSFPAAEPRLTAEAARRCSSPHVPAR